MRIATVADILRRAAEEYREKPAFWTTPQRTEHLTYGDVYAEACRIAQHLVADGLAPGENVSIFAPNRHEWSLAFWGIVLAGGVVIPLDSNSGPAELEHALKDTGSTRVFTTTRHLPQLADFAFKSTILLDSGKGGHLELADVLKAPPARDPGVSVSPDDPVTIIYTSGTTNQPKGVVLSHEGVISNLTGVIDVMHFNSNDLFLSLISLSHTFEITCGLIMPAMFGGSVAYVPDHRYTTIFRYAREFQPTVLLCVPLMYQILLENAVDRVTGKHCLLLSEIEKDDDARERMAEEVRKVFGGKARHFISGGAPLAVVISQGYREAGISLLQGYGLTETAGVSTLTPPDDCPFGSVGKPLPGVDVRIDHPGADGVGEVCIAGPHLMKAYKDNPEATREMIRDGWLHSGDLGRLDEHGHLFITGRSKNIIVTAAGVNVHPEELEERIVRSPFIREVCVIGKERTDRTETVFAAIVLDEDRVNRFIAEEKSKGNGPSLLSNVIWSELEKHTADLASFKRVLEFQIRNSPLPRGRTNKVLRNVVKRESFSILGRLGRLEKFDESQHPLVFTNATVVTPFRIVEKTCLVIEGGKITQLGRADQVYLPPNAQIMDLQGGYLMPGFIDLHVHGGGGLDFSTSNEQEILPALDYYISHGTTRLLATVYVEEETRYLQAVRNLASLCRKHPCCGVLHGLHMEGPFLNRDMSGAMNPDYIWPATIANFLKLHKVGEGFIKMMTLAPEVPDAHDVMQVASQEGVALAIGHSRATYEEIEVAIDLGASQVTHIFNAMPTMHHRSPGVLTAAFLRPELKVHLIADGVHVHPATISLLYKLKDSSGIILISDAISASGCEDGAYTVSEQPITVRGGRAYLENGSLAGSTVTLDRSLKYVVENTAIPLQEAVRMITLNPARVLGLDHRKGIIAVGKDADLVVIDRHFHVTMTVMDGQIVYSRGKLPSR